MDGSRKAKTPFFKRGILKSRKWRIIIGIFLLLVIIRLILPSVVLHFANKTLANMDGYYGHIRDIDISLYRGAYQINDIYINKQDSSTGEQTGFFKAKEIDLSVEWRAIFHGSIVGELEFSSPELIFTKEKVELGDVKKDTSDFRKILKDFMPLRVNRFEINNGKLKYADHTSSPRVDVTLGDLYVLALNLTNAADSAQVLPSSVTARANAYEGTLNFNMRLDPLAERATFDVNMALENLNLVLLNDFLKAYGRFDVNRGVFGLYSEVAAKEGAFKGYVKPIIRDLDVVGEEDRKDNFFTKIWESIVGAAGIVFRNQKKDQVATRVEMQGDFKDPDTDIWDAVWQVLRNAFIQALMPSVENQINIGSVGEEDGKKKEGLLKKIFGGKKEK